MSNFDKCLKPLLEDEGGNDDDPHDPGGRTSRGIIQSEYNHYRRVRGLAQRDVWSASDEEVSYIYKTEYWDVLQCDFMPTGVDYCVFDYGVNSGISRSAKVLQRIIGAEVDGVVGPQTVRMVSGMSSANIINAMSAERLDFLHELRTWGRYGRGWARRVQHVKSLSLQMNKEE